VPITAILLTDDSSMNSIKILTY